MVARPWSSSRLSCGERLLLRCDGNPGNSLPTTHGKDPTSRARRRKRGSSGCGRDSRASSRVETGMSGYFWSLPRGVRLRLELGHSRALSSRAVATVSRFPSRGSRDLWLSLEACPRGFPTGLSHVPPWCESILGLKVVAVQGKQVSLEWTEISGGLWEWWHDPGVPLALPVESPSP